MRALLSLLMLASVGSRPAFGGGGSDTLLPEKAATAINTDMIKRLGALGPRPAQAPQSALFNRFVGAWDASYETYEKDGTVRRNQGQVIFGWILDGWAMQDIWIWNPDDEEPEGNIGTTIRFYDRRHDRWTVVWVTPPKGVVAVLTGGEVDGRIVLTTRDETGAQRRWSFNDITENTFVWRGERSVDDGKTWHVYAESRMRRRVAQ